MSVTTPQAPADRAPADARWLLSLKSEVQPVTFKKGRQYAESRRVTLLPRDGKAVAAKVLGSTGDKYDVELSPADSGVASRCNCPSWNKYGPHCKHVVAAALVYLARTRAAESTAAPAPVDGEARPAAPEVSLPALAKLENWLGLSTLPEFEYFYRLTPATRGSTGVRRWVVDARRADAA
jgi:uncharacterized Zn finger protein